MPHVGAGKSTAASDGQGNESGAPSPPSAEAHPSIPANSSHGQKNSGAVLQRVGEWDACAAVCTEVGGSVADFAIQ